MKKITVILLGFLLTHYCFSQSSQNYAQDEIIVKFKPDAAVNLTQSLTRKKFEHRELDLLNQSYALQEIALTGNKKKGDTYLLHFSREQDIESVIERYQQTQLFEYVEPNYIGRAGGVQGSLATTPDDALFSRQWGLYNDGTFFLSPAVEDADIDMELAWDIEQGDSTIVMAILDTGLKLDHPDISDRVWVNPNETNNSTDDDKNGYVGDIRGWDFANNDNDPTDDQGHGTNVAGIIGADANNGIGYAGVDWACRLMICKVINKDDFGLYSWWAQAIYYAVDNGADVINMSIGGSSFSRVLEEAVDYAHSKGVVVVACMMNEDGEAPYYPAAYSNTIAVGSTNPNDERTSPFFWRATSGSNYGNHIDVVAPGNYIYGLNYQSNTNYGSYWGGTSQAAPLVAGLSTLLLAQDPTRSPDDIRSIIRNTAEDQIGNAAEDAPGYDKYYGYGRINAYQALLPTTTSVRDAHREEMGFTVYLDPFSERLSIRNKRIHCSISLKNILGKEVYSQEIKSSQDLIEIDISHLPAGVYLVSATDRAGKIFQSEKVIIK